MCHAPGRWVLLQESNGPCGVARCLAPSRVFAHAKSLVGACDLKDELNSREFFALTIGLDSRKRLKLCIYKQGAFVPLR